MKSYFAVYQSSPAAEAVEATVLVFDKNLSIGFRDETGKNHMINWLLKEVSASFNFTGQQSRVRHPRQGELLIEGKDAATFILDRQAEQRKPWYRKSSGSEWIRNSFLMLFILAALFGLYMLVVPWISQQMASKLSIKTEQHLGDAVYNALNLSSIEDTAGSRLLNDFFYEMDIPTAYNIRISLIKDDVVNAFALPGGQIVVYSAMLKEISSYPELAALLSHEFTHVNNKHSTKSIFRRLGSKIFLGLLFGRFGTVTSVVVDHADNLRSLKYSRRLEKEADLEGLGILLKRDIDPAGFENLFNHLKKAAPVNALPEFLGSHPDVNKRIRYINEMAKGASVEEDAELKAIFENLKN